LLNYTNVPFVKAHMIISSCIRCDRILWFGRGLNQLSYVRGESRLSDHRPVYSIFTAEVESIDHSKIRNMSCPSSRIEVEELLQYSDGYTGLNFFWKGVIPFFWSIRIFHCLMLPNPHLIICVNLYVGIGFRKLASGFHGSAFGN